MIEQLLQADRLLTVDQVEQARGVYARVVELDPGNAIAVVGLARCALAEGDDRAAHDLASQALRIDPENDMARRMEARLAEILATRGEPVDRPGQGTLGATGVASVPGASSAAPLRPIVTEGPGSLSTADVSTPARRSLLDRLRGRG